MNKLVKDLVRSVQPDTKRVCLKCVQDAVISAIFANGPVEVCFACTKAENPTVDVQQLASLVQKDAPLRYEVDPELYSGYRGMTLEQVISQMLLSDNPVLIEEIASLLVIDEEGDDPDNPTFFWKGNTYQQTGLPFDSEKDEKDYVLRQWEKLTLTLMHKHRFFNKEAEKFFGQIFREALQITTNTLMGERIAVLKEIPVGFQVYRARVASEQKIQGDILENPTKQMGAPPSATATNNRMNPAGISLFYGATKLDTCIAEVRPSIGDKVAVARFVTIKPLKLFDFHGLDHYLRFPRISPFEDDPVERRMRQLFLKYLHQEIAKPTRNEGMSYIVTQAMAEFFAKEHGDEFDGFFFQSVQEQGGRNIVLFGKSDADLEPQQEPTFPMALDGEVTYFDVTSVKYQHKPSKIAD
ncbi:RES family NAD+ phosphorylase [Dyella acidisoli]|uniref:RES domain-containing protein n=1 Tax=Dyella acidisoli TaxID=1867834 RepID=A0ABQ5XUA7_9GAMM|nr:RES family NAD+ phosphorylase [Dyella acidisoli]GLQ94337.1 hypothetical protein GCM10007901_32890 [Dyella acidisoli]